MARNKRHRWYDAQGQKHIHSSALEKSSGLRRLLSLVVLLVMVLMLIQQTSDVKKVGKVATAIGLLPDPNLPQAASMRSNSESTETKSGQIDLALSANMIEQITLIGGDSTVKRNQQIWRALLRKAQQPVVESLATKFYRETPVLRADSKTTPANISDIDRWKPVVDWASDAKTQLEQWEEIERVNDSPSSVSEFANLFQENAWWFSQPATEVSTRDDAFVRGFLLALDERILDQVIDNSAWLTLDRIPFARTWQRIESLQLTLASRLIQNSHIASMEVRQLMTGGKAYRGKPLKFEGTIYRVDAIATFSDSALGSQTYQRIWIKPDSDSNQPVAVYAPTDSIDSSALLEKDTHVTLVGFFFKRIAYASQQGSEIAPLILAAHVFPFEAKAAGSTTENPLLAVEVAEQNRRPWQPPVDTATPYSLVSTSMERALESISPESIDLAFRGADAAQSLKPLLELERLGPEVNLLLKTQPDWPIVNSASLSRISGLITKLERLSVETKIPQLKEMKYLYRCRVDSDAKTTFVLASSVPSGWLRSDGTPTESIRQPCSMDALKLVQSDGNAVAWTRSMRWISLVSTTSSNKIEYRPELSAPNQFLLEHNWDLSWIDLVRDQESDQIHTFAVREKEPYFSLMALANRAEYPNEMTTAKVAAPTRTIPELMETFRKKQKGTMPAIERLTLNMRIVRVSRVEVESPEDVAILGSNHYFQLDAMADIGNRTYEMKGDREPIVYHREYPVTCVAIDLPSWLIDPANTPKTGPSNEIHQVWYPGTKANAEGWFYRFWSYKTQETQQTKGDTRKQIGPLIILDRMKLGYRVQDGAQVVSGKIVSSVTTVIGVLGAIGIWWYVRQKRPKRLSFKSKKQ